MALQVSTGVGESVLDLSGLQVTDLDVNSGVGQTRVTLPAQGRVSAKVSGGVGQLIVTIPDGMAARVHASAGLVESRLRAVPAQWPGLCGRQLRDGG